METYELGESADKLHFQFVSNGPKGKIRKVINYRQTGPFRNTFNLSFGDWNDEDKYSDDEVITNNNDRNKVLATVALSMTRFNKEHPDCDILIIGSSCSRTRLYQIAISKFRHQFAEMFEISGFLNGEWQLFRRGVNYDGFLFKPKKL